MPGYQAGGRGGGRRAGHRRWSAGWSWRPCLPVGSDEQRGGVVLAGVQVVLDRRPGFLGDLPTRSRSPLPSTHRRSGFQLLRSRRRISAMRAPVDSSSRIRARSRFWASVSWGSASRSWSRSVASNNLGSRSGSLGTSMVAPRSPGSHSSRAANRRKLCSATRRRERAEMASGRRAPFGPVRSRARCCW